MQPPWCSEPDVRCSVGTSGSGYWLLVFSGLPIPCVRHKMRRTSGAGYWLACALTMRQGMIGENRRNTMRVVLIGVSHWHTPFFLDPCLAMPDVSIVGVSDPDAKRAEPVAA